jgi:hypothetical protein
VQDCCVPDVYRNLASLFYNTAVCHVTAGGEITCQVNDVADMDIFKVLRGDGGDQDLLAVSEFYCHFCTLLPEYLFVSFLLGLSGSI